MFGFRINKPTGMSREIQDEVSSICRDAQIRNLALPAHLRKDIGIDCGCDDNRPLPVPTHLP